MLPIQEPRDPRVIWREGDEPEPVTPRTPLTGLELDVLRVWTETSRFVQKALKTNRPAIETLVRRRVFDAMTQELQLRADGLEVHEAEERTRPEMWAPPTAL